MMACSRATAGLTIPPNQTFILGESETRSYRGSLRNDSPHAVTLQLGSKTSKDVTNLGILKSKEKIEVRVDPDQIVYIINNSDVQADLLVNTSHFVSGMGYKDNK